MQIQETSAASIHVPVYAGSAPPHSLLLSAPSMDFWLSNTQSDPLARIAANRAGIAHLHTVEIRGASALQVLSGAIKH